MKSHPPGELVPCLMHLLVRHHLNVKTVKTMGQMRQKLWGKSAKGKCFIAYDYYHYFLESVNYEL